MAPCPSSQFVQNPYNPIWSAKPTKLVLIVLSQHSGDPSSGEEGHGCLPFLLAYLILLLLLGIIIIMIYNDIDNITILSLLQGLPLVLLELFLGQYSALPPGRSWSCSWTRIFSFCCKIKYFSEYPLFQPSNQAVPALESPSKRSWHGSLYSGRSQVDYFGFHFDVFVFLLFALRLVFLLFLFLLVFCFLILSDFIWLSWAWNIFQCPVT